MFAQCPKRPTTFMFCWMCAAALYTHLLKAEQSIVTYNGMYTLIQIYRCDALVDIIIIIVFELSQHFSKAYIADTKKKNKTKKEECSLWKRGTLSIYQQSQSHCGDESKSKSNGTHSISIVIVRKRARALLHAYKATKTIEINTHSTQLTVFRHHFVNFQYDMHTKLNIIWMCMIRWHFRNI